MLVKGIKKGKSIELLEELDLPDNQEVLVEIKKVNNFWSAYQNFRAKVEQEGIGFKDEDLADLRDRSTGREVDLCLQNIY